MGFFSSFFQKKFDGRRNKELVPSPSEPTSTHSSPNPSFTKTPPQDNQQNDVQQGITEEKMSTMNPIVNQTFLEPQGLYMKERVMSPLGVSLEFMYFLMEDVQEKKRVPNTNLVVLQREITVTLDDGTIKILQTGRTAKLLNEDHIAKVYKLRVPYIIEEVEVAMAECRPKPRDEWTVEDICEHVVKPATVKNQSFFHEEIDQKHVGPKHRGAFVSQARNTRFSVLLDALKTWCVDQGKKSAECYVWLDAFSANQPLLTSGDANEEEQDRREWILKYGLHEMIGRFDDTVLVLDSWQEAFALKRAWCLWELYGAVMERKDGFQVVLPRSEMDKFEDMLRNKYDSLVKALINVDVAKAQCNVAKDLEMIMNEVGTEIEQVNTVVQTHMRAWFVRSGQAHVDRLRADAGTADTNDTGSLLALMTNLGKLYTAQGNHDAADVVLADAERIGVMKLVETDTTTSSELDSRRNIAENGLRKAKAAHGPDHLDVAVAANNLGLWYAGYATYDEAEAMYLDALRIYKLLDMINHKNVANTEYNLATLYMKQGKYNKAEAMYLDALRINRVHFGLDHSQVADNENDLGLFYSDEHNFAMLYRKQGKYDEAEVMYVDALRIYKIVYGLNHPKVGMVENNLGSVYRKQGKYDEAVAMYVDVLRIYKVVHGPNHADVAKVEKALGDLYALQGKHDEARTMRADAKRISKHLRGNKPEVVVTADMLNNLYELPDNSPDTIKNMYAEAMALFAESQRLYAEIQKEEEEIVLLLRRRELRKNYK